MSDPHGMIEMMTEAQQELKRASNARYRERNRDRIRERGRLAARLKRASLPSGKRNGDPQNRREYMRRWRSENRERYLQLQRESMARWRQRNPDKARSRGRESDFRRALKRHDLDIQGYEKLLAEQGGGCGICGSASPRRSRSERLFIDHCHETGAVRGLLCNLCNTLLGYSGDHPMRLRAAADYLDRSRRPPTAEER